jgi:non-heme chloroperoxidase
VDTSPHTSNFANVNGIRLHYLDWGGNGPVLLFLTGLGLSAHIYDKFAPRFTDKFHVLGLTRRGHGDSDYPEAGYDPDTLAEDVRLFMDSLEIDKAVLVGHSLANVELVHFTARHPQRVLKLVFLDTAYDRTAPAFKIMMEKNPLRTIPIPGVNDVYCTIEGYTDFLKRAYPALAAIWSELLDEEIQHNIKKNPDGKIVDRMPDPIAKALNETMDSYAPEYSQIQAPLLRIFVTKGGSYYVSPDYMTEDQKARVVEYFDVVRPPLIRELIEQFRRSVPHARIVEIPEGHHYCFIKQEELVFDEMRNFLLPIEVT